jgi:hypothetical protein
MKRRVAITLFVVAIIVCIGLGVGLLAGCGGTTTAAGGPNEIGLPMYGANPAHTGVYASGGPSQLGGLDD